ncbi:MAG: hypothetical protein MRJ66_10575 [Nitrospira sp.]|nr:hypothetical protein [Nitrospira sp.]
MIKKLRVRFLFCLTILITALAGCQTGPFSGAAAMRVDVDVYKGPLSEEPEVQWGILLGNLRAARRVLIETDNFTRSVIANKEFSKATSSEASTRDQWPLPRIPTSLSSVQKPIDHATLGLPSAEDPSTPAAADNFCRGVRFENAWYHFRVHRLFGLLDDMDHYDCLILMTIVSDTVLFIKEIDGLSIPQLSKSGTRPYNTDELHHFIQEVGRLSAQLRDQAFRWAIASTSGQSLDFKVRIAVVNAIVGFSEIGNQLKCRINALAQQIDDKTGLDRRELAPSVALCDAEPTNFLNLYAQFDAAVYSFLTKYWQGIGVVEDRVKIVRDLFSDHYWSRINTVYASGRGKVSMAFIKDDVGNWNLKSFDNDPEDLLKAYTNFSIESAKRAALLIQSASPGAAAIPVLQVADALIEKANGTAFGQEPTRMETTIIPPLHRQTKAKLLALAKQYEIEDVQLLDDYRRALKEVKESNGSAGSETKKQLLSHSKDRLIQHRRSMLDDLHHILREHKNNLAHYF